MQWIVGKKYKTFKGDIFVLICDLDKLYSGHYHSKPLIFSNVRGQSFSTSNKGINEKLGFMIIEELEEYADHKELASARRRIEYV